MWPQGGSLGSEREMACVRGRVVHRMPAGRAAFRSARNTGGVPASERSQPGVVLLSADPHHLPRTAQALSRAARRGDLVRLSPGVYVETDRWLLSPPWDRHRMVIAANSLSRRGTAVFCHLTALELHRLPLPHVPGALHVRASSRGRAGTSVPASAYVNEERTRQAADQLSKDPGHRHLSGPLPALPAVRRHGNLLGLEPGLDRAVRVAVLLSDGTWMAEVFVDPLPVTLASAFSQEPVTVTAPAADALARRGGVLDSLGSSPGRCCPVEKHCAGSTRLSASRTAARSLRGSRSAGC